MKFLEGTDLSARIKQGGRIPPHELLNLVRQICAALECVHQQGVVTATSSRRTSSLRPRATSRCSTSASPRGPDRGHLERHAGRHADVHVARAEIRGEVVDHRSDIYALGSVIFEMATGVTLFAGKTDFEVMAAHVSRPVPDPTEHDMPPALARVIRTALAKHRDDRFQSAGELTSSRWRPPSRAADRRLRHLGRIGRRQLSGVAAGRGRCRRRRGRAPTAPRCRARATRGRNRPRRCAARFACAPT